MKQLHFNGQVFEGERLVRNADSITGYDAKKEIFAFRGVSDFSGFTLGEGQEFDVASPSESERIAMLEDTINFLLGL